MPTVESNGIEMFYHDYGSGEPLIVLHGATADHQAWAEVLQPLTDDYRVVVCDLRGHGKTGRSDQGRYTVDTYVEDIAAFIDEIGLDRPAVLGHSWGGMIGYAVASQHPDTVGSLITVGSSSPRILSKTEWVMKKGLMPVMTRVQDINWLTRGIQWGVSKLFGDDASVEEDDLERLRAEHDCNVPELDSEEASKVTRASADYFGSDRSVRIPDTPVLMLYGENEPLIDPHAAHFEEVLGNCRSIEIPDGTHNAHVDNPDFIRRKVRAFLDEHGQPSDRGTPQEPTSP
jgi:pimeloyl-ACP methyl ester carboxylesterase